MANIKLLSNEMLLECLGADNPDASEGVLYSTKNKIDFAAGQRVLVIGLGGQGIKTANRIKAMVTSKFDSYQNKIAFLALDTDWTDLERLVALDDDEKKVFGNDMNINSRYNVAANRSNFTNSWINPNFYVELDYPGASQIRQACRAKLFDAAVAANHEDDKIRQAIDKCIQNITGQTFDPKTMKVAVHIVAGISGGTGSGSIVEMAHFVGEPSMCRVKSMPMPCFLMWWSNIIEGNPASIISMPMGMLPSRRLTIIIP